MLQFVIHIISVLKAVMVYRISTAVTNNRLINTSACCPLPFFGRQEVEMSAHAHLCTTAYLNTDAAQLA